MFKKLPEKKRNSRECRSAKLGLALQDPVLCRKLDILLNLERVEWQPVSLAGLRAVQM